MLGFRRHWRGADDMGYIRNKQYLRNSIYWILVHRHCELKTLYDVEACNGDLRKV